MDDKIVVEQVCKHKIDEHTPTILKFQNGSLGGVSHDNAQYSTVEYDKTKRKRALVVTSQNIYTGDYQKNPDTDTYICVRNKTTNKVQILPVQQALLTNHIYEKLERNKSKEPVLSKEHAMKRLLKEFAGRKTSRFMANTEEMNVNIEVVREELDKSVQAMRDDDADDEVLPGVNINNEAYMATIVPKFDKEAKIIADVYDVEDVIPRPLLDRLDEEAKVVYATPLETLPIESEYLRGCIKNIQDKTVASKKDFENLKLIIYMDALQKLISLRKSQMKTVELSRITEKIENDIRRRFADPNVVKSFTRTNFSTEKALTHFIVLAMLISEKYEIDVEVLSRTLKIAKARLISYAHIVNARPKSRSSILSLRLPSTMPALKPSGRRFKK